MRSPSHRCRSRTSHSFDVRERARSVTIRARPINHVAKSPTSIDDRRVQPVWTAETAAGFGVA